MSVQSNFKTRTSRRLGNDAAVDINIYVDKLPQNTSGYKVLEPESSTKYELIYHESIVGTPGEAGYLVCPVTNGRGLSLTATTRTTVSANVKTHGAGVVVIEAPDHYTLNDKVSRTEETTYTGEQIFEDLKGTGEFQVPVFADAAARDAAIPTPENGMECYLTDIGKFNDYTAGSWVEREAGGTFPNMSTTVAGKGERATTTEILAGTETGGTGAPLVVNPADLLAVSKQTSAGAADDGKYVRLNSAGQVDLTMLTGGFETITDRSESYTPAYLTSGANVFASHLLWTTLTDGEFAITIDGTPREITGIDFSTATSMEDVATILQTAIRAVTSGEETVEWNSGTSRVVINSGLTTSSSAITETSTVAAPAGTDISGAGANNYLDMDSGNGVVTATALNITGDAGKLVGLETDGYVNSDLTKPATPITRVYTANDTWTKPANFKGYIIVEGVGGGGGSAGGDGGDTKSSGGGGGGYFKKQISYADLGDTETVTVGSAGTSGPAGGTPSDGGDGGTTSFGAHCSATGGSGAAEGAVQGGVGGVGTDGDINISGQNGGCWLRAYTGSASIPQVGGRGGDSMLGLGGAPSSIVALVGTGYGAGGGGGASNSTERKGAAGTAGVVIVTEFY